MNLSPGKSSESVPPKEQKGGQSAETLVRHIDLSDDDKAHLRLLFDHASKTLERSHLTADEYRSDCKIAVEKPLRVTFDYPDLSGKKKYFAFPSGTLQTSYREHSEEGVRQNEFSLLFEGDDQSTFSIKPTHTNDGDYVWGLSHVEDERHTPIATLSPHDVASILTITAKSIDSNLRNRWQDDSKFEDAHHRNKLLSGLSVIASSSHSSESRYCLVEPYDTTDSLTTVYGALLVSKSSQKQDQALVISTPALDIGYGYLGKDYVFTNTTRPNAVGSHQSIKTILRGGNPDSSYDLLGTEDGSECVDIARAYIWSLLKTPVR